MRSILEQNRGYAAEVVLRLAWNLGLYREEMYNLKWKDISFAEQTVHLPDRTVPMGDEVAACLEARSKTYRGRLMEYVIVADKHGTHMLPQSISRLARTTLNRGGLPDINLIDLRHDYIIRQLEQHDWPYVSRITGEAVSTLYANYSEYYTKGRGIKPNRPKAVAPDEYKLWKIIEAEGASPEGLALWMTWKLGMRVREILELTWEQVDLESGAIILDDRRIELSTEFLTRLQITKARRSEGADPHVLLTPRSQRPFDYARLSRSVRTILIRGGMEDVLLKDLLLDEKREDEDERILQCAREQGFVTKRDVIRMFGFSEKQAHTRLNQFVERGTLIRVGAKCFLPDAVVPPEEQYRVIREYLETVGTSFRKDLADLLRLDGRQCGVILQRFVAEGKLVRKGQIYSLPDPEKSEKKP